MIELTSELTSQIEACHQWLDEILGDDSDRSVDNLRLRCERLAKHHTATSERPHAEFTPELRHFFTLIQSGWQRGSSNGSRACEQLADCVCQHVPDLDEHALAGLHEFIDVSKYAPETAQRLLRKGRP